jgi:hypothetical protein
VRKGVATGGHRPARAGIMIKVPTEVVEEA